MRRPASEGALRAARTLAVVLVLAAGAAGPLAAQDSSTGTVVFLVRHAEKVEDDSADPALTDAGRERARDLSRALKDAGIDRIHSTDTRRTRRTAAPLAERLGLRVRRYDGTALEAFARRLRLRGAGDRHLVVGHSDTTPELVRLLGGEPGPPIVEAWEYDRLYVLTLDREGGARTVLLRFGAPARP